MEAALRDARICHTVPSLGGVKAGRDIGRLSRGQRLILATLLTGISAGLVAMCLSLMLHAIQHLAYGYSLGPRSVPETFLQGVVSASPARRFWALIGAGVVAGTGWWALARFAPPRVSVTRAVGPDETSTARMPVFTTLIHVLLQEITVALGSPLGREVAPREAATLFGQLISHGLSLSPADARVLAACGAGAGLAAVYNVPLAGTIFTLEVLLRQVSARTVVLALVTSVIATVTAWTGLGNEAQYDVPQFRPDAALLFWSLLVGPALGAGAYVFKIMTSRLERAAPSGWQRIVLSMIVFAGLGLAASIFPALPGNGKGPLQLLFEGTMTSHLIVALLCLKVIAVAGALRAGGAGGILTPSMIVGALGAALLGRVWGIWFPHAAVGAYALVGASAFMGSVLAMPMTALVLMTELSTAGADLIAPMALATATAFATCRSLELHKRNCTDPAS